jgi:hypothetical protein
MSAPPKFAKLADAIAAYREGRSRRWAEVDGWQIDLVQAQAEAGRVREEPLFLMGVPVIVAEPGQLPPGCDAMFVAPMPRDLHDEMVAANVAAELARAANVLPELAVPEVAADASAHRCPWCSQPWDGAR